MRHLCEIKIKRTLLTFTIVLFSMLSFSATYYVSSTGNDTNSGLSSSLPWRTLSKVNSVTFSAGDQILFQKDNTFYGSLTVRNSGASGSTIMLGSYGSGANPLITGFTNVDAWTSLGNNIWESTNAVSTLSACNLVTINGVNTAMGRYPNFNESTGGYLALQSHSGNTSITSSSLTGTPNWTGAEIVIRSNSYIMDVRTISSQSGGTLTFSTGTSYSPTDGWGFFIQNDSRTLDASGEWYYNPTTKKIRIYSSAQPTNVKVASVEDLITVLGNYVKISGIDFSGANNNAIYTALSTLTYTTIENCSINFSGRTGIKFRSNYLNVTGNTIQYSNNRAIDLEYSQNVTVSNNTIRHTGLWPGMAVKKGTEGIWAALYVGNILNLTCQYNTVINSGYVGILYGGSSSDLAKINNNFIDTYCTVLDDGGGIYGGRNGRLENNIVINGIGALKGTTKSGGNAVGIYLDDNSQNNIVINNSIANASWNGIYLHDASNNTVTGNTVFNSGEQQLYIQDGGDPGTSENNVITDNILVSKSSGQYVAQYRFPEAIYSMGTVDRNYYMRPIAETTTIRVTSSAGARDYTLAGWQSVSNSDPNSKVSPQSISSESDFQFEYNAGTTAKTIVLSRPMIDAKGTKYSGSIVLQPYTSALLLRDANAAAVVAPNAPTSVVATAGNASATVSFTVPSSNGGSAITGYAVTSNPAGGIDNNAGSTSLTHTITGLTNGVSYTFTARATNSVGTSVASSPSNAVIPKAPAVATGFTFTGPASGNVNSTSSNFTVTPNNNYTGTITITFTGTGSTGLAAKVLSFSNTSTAQSFTITPSVVGNITLIPTNNSGIINPASLNYNVNPNAPNAPTSVVATAGNASGTVTFAVPSSNGGSAITGYTVTSNPAGGIDNNAGSTSLTHTITGLTNGVSYTFTARATNSVGTSVASSPSNAVIPKAPAVATGFTFTGPASGNVNSTSSNFTVTPNNNYTGTITITFTGTGSTGLAAKVLSFSNTSTAQSFTITPSVVGNITIIPTNNSDIINPASLNYNVNPIAPNAPTSVVATAGNASATVSFAVPSSNGGSAITGYTVTSNPAGGIDNNAGSTSLTHTITGLTNGVSYTFTARATNSVGTSVASSPSNAVIPKAPADITSPVITEFSIPSTSNLLTVPIYTFTAIDIVGVTGYLLTETSFVPLSNAVGWSSQAPLNYTFTASGTKTLYAWVKDAAGNISSSLTGIVTISKLNSRSRNGKNLKNGQVSTDEINVIEGESINIQIFPNPSNGKVIVSFSNLPQVRTSIEILDISGRKIDSRYVANLYEEFSLEHLTPGTYFIKSIIGSDEKIQKLILK